jgi:hypothetical protein
MHRPRSDERTRSATPGATPPNRLDASVLAALRGGAASTDTVAERAGVSHADAEATLHRLAAGGQVRDAGSAWELT